MNHHEDDDLRRRLRAIDPAASLAPAPPERVARLLEDAMSTQQPHSGSAATARRSPLAWLAAAAAVVLVAGLSFAVLRGGDEPQAPTASGPSSQSPATESPATGSADEAAPAPEPGSTTELVAADAGNAKCMMPNAQVLRGNTTAFEGTVTAIEGDQVTLEPSRWFKGTPTETVTVTAPSEQLQQVLVAVDFEVGGRYLVTAFQDTVTLCGFSAAYDEELASLYKEAYSA